MVVIANLIADGCRGLSKERVCNVSISLNIAIHQTTGICMVRDLILGRGRHFFFKGEFSTAP